MMKKEDNESWKVTIASEDSLNFAIFVGCIYGLIDKKSYEGKIDLWPSELLKLSLNSEDSLSLLRKQWRNWFESLIIHRSNEIDKDNYANPICNLYNPPEFVELEFGILKDCCKNAWTYFEKWWYMPAGGKAALSFYEGLDIDKIHDYIKIFENKVERKVKPFNIYIDIVYTGIMEKVEVSNRYIIALPVPVIGMDKNWWLNKLEQIG